MIVSINQPAYLPWLGYFQRIAMSDLHITLDHVQFEKNSFTNRNKIKTANSWCWLTVPVKTKGKFGDLPINSVEIDNNSNWKTKQWKAIINNYCKASYFPEHQAFFEMIYQQDWQNLLHLCNEINYYLLKAFEISVPLLSSSTIVCKKSKDELILELCQKVGASTYLSGSLGRNYIREELFQEAGIKVIYQDYHPPQYPQCLGLTFDPYMSAIDLLFNCGSDSFKILMSGQEKIQS